VSLVLMRCSRAQCDLDRSGRRLGPQTLTLAVTNGDWTVMVMNADTSRRVRQPVTVAPVVAGEGQPQPH
jgi:hypothetical protein